MESLVVYIYEKESQLGILVTILVILIITDRIIILRKSDIEVL